MKHSIVIAGDNAPENAFVVWRGYQRSIEKAARMGYEGVELALGGREDVNPGEINGWLKNAGIEISCISTGLTYAQRGLYLTHPDADMRKKTIGTLKGLIELAETWGGLVNLGRSRGFIGPGQTAQETEARFAEGIEALLPVAQQHGVRLIVEPINRYESNFINRVSEAKALIDRYGWKNVGIMADVFHMNIEEDDIPLQLLSNADRIWYVHMADSNRLAPGMGHTVFPAILRMLKHMNYSGWISVEILANGDPDGLADHAIRHLRACGV